MLRADMSENKVEKPLLSIITVVFNGIDEIEATIKSVIFQKQYCNIEYVVVDGASDDGTVDLINTYKGDIDLIISEPDSGIYDAMNKGVSHSTGRWYYFLNAGDELISIPVKNLSNTSSAAIIYGDVLLKESGRYFRSRCSWLIRIINTIHHQSCFYNSKILIPYDTRYKVFSDFDLNQKIYKRKEETIKLNLLIASHSCTGVSNTCGEAFSENYKIVRKNFGPIYVLLAWLAYKIRGGIRKLA